MAIEVPGWTKPLFDIFKLKWPDINEDKVRELGGKINTLGDAAHTFAQTIDTHLATLANASESEALLELSSLWNDGTTNIVSKINDATSEAPPVFNLAGDAIATYKLTIIGILTAQVGTSLAGGPISILIKMVAREALAAAIDQATEAALQAIASEIKSQIDTRVIEPVQGAVKDLVTSVTTPIKDQVVELVPTFSGGANAANAAKLYIDLLDVSAALQEIENDYTAFIDAINDFRAKESGEDYSEPTGGPPADPTARALLIEMIIEPAKEVLINQLQEMAWESLTKISESIIAIYDNYVAADTLLAGEAELLSTTWEFPPPPVPYQIDRSAQPTTYTIVRADDPLKTGPGQSDASKRAQQITIDRAAPPVKTGAGQSDARTRIQQVTIDRAEDPLKTGPGHSDARANIQEIVLPPTNGNS